ncbi:MAG: hypothetical protein ABTR20_07540, partial [Candidatus Competibacter sp.]
HDLRLRRPTLYPTELRAHKEKANQNTGIIDVRPALVVLFWRASLILPVASKEFEVSLNNDFLSLRERAYQFSGRAKYHYNYEVLAVSKPQHNKPNSQCRSTALPRRLLLGNHKVIRLNSQRRAWECAAGRERVQ